MNGLIKNLKLKRRAVTVLAALHFYGNPSAKLKIVGVTGTNGKTTTATLLYRIATELGYKAGLIGTVENIIVNEVRPSTHTTPGPVQLNKLLSEMVAKGCEYVFMEVSSHAIDQKRISGVNFVGGIFTNLTHDHLDYHKSFENYFLAKKKFFEILPKTAFALSNSDDEHGRAMIGDIEARQFLYGFNGGEDFHGEISKLNFLGLELIFNDPARPHDNSASLPSGSWQGAGGEKIKAKLLGKFNAYNLLSVWSTTKLLGFDMEKVKNILEDIKPPRGRFDHFMSASGVLVVVDYAHTPDALEKILLALWELKQEKGRIISVFGCGGDRDPLKRRIMGKIGATLSSVAIFTSDNPRSENPESIIDEMKTDLSLADSKKVIAITNRHNAILEAVHQAKEGDVILCAGKGHEDYQEIKGVKHHFNDLEELKNAFK